MLGFALLAFGLGALFIDAFGSNDELEPDHIHLEPGDDAFQGTSGDDVVSAAKDYLGPINGAAGNDTLNVAGTSKGIEISTEDTVNLWFSWDDMDASATNGAPLAVFGGAGDDHITVEGHGTGVDTGAGNDTVDLSHAFQTLVDGNLGDTILGSDVATDGDVRVQLYDGSQLQGGDSGDFAIGLGTGHTTMLGGLGDDTLFGQGTAALISGGAGNDLLAGGSIADGPSEYEGIEWHVDSDADTLDGGAGDDRLVIGRGDIATLGSGADQVLLLNLGSTGDAARITDFDPTDDTLHIELENNAPGSSTSYDLVGDVEVRETGGHTIILHNGVEIAKLDGVTNLRIGLGTPELEFGTTLPATFTTLTGATASKSDFDVIVSVFKSGYD